MAVVNQKKLFRNCPKEEEFSSEYREDCRNCPKYEDCLSRKCQRIIRKQKERKKRKIKLLTLLGIGIILLVLSLILVIYFLFSVYDDSIMFVETTHIDLNKDESQTSESYDETTESITMIETQSTGRHTTPTVMADEMPEEIHELKETNDEAIVVLSQEISAFAPGEDYYYIISYEDKIIMAKVLYKECRGECFKGKVAVAAVILNRFYSDLSEFNTESIYAVVTQGTQFADISEVTMEDLESVPECMDAVEAACKGWDPTREMFPEGAKHFYAPKGDIAPYQLAIREDIQELVIGNHNFHNEFNMENVEERVERIIEEQKSK